MSGIKLKGVSVQGRNPLCVLHKAHWCPPLQRCGQHTPNPLGHPESISGKYYLKYYLSYSCKITKQVNCTLDTQAGSLSLQSLTQDKPPVLWLTTVIYWGLLITDQCSESHQN
jgi:hypothetical protein